MDLGMPAPYFAKIITRNIRRDGFLGSYQASALEAEARADEAVVNSRLNHEKVSTKKNGSPILLP
jgi:hypothetical protein